MADEVPETLEKIGAALRDARLKMFLTQSEVGQIAGVSRQLVSRIEQGSNGEINAYIAVAAALHHRLTIVEESDPSRSEPAGLDFTNLLSPQADD
jgi:transcriptional regulator with XRE-family HTH domain